MTRQSFRMPTLRLIHSLRLWNRLRLDRRQRRRAARDGEALDYAGWVARHDTIGDIERAHLHERAMRLTVRPLVSVLMPVCDPGPAWLDQAIASVRAQIYDRWELCIADDHSADPRVRNLLTRHAEDDPRIRIAWRSRSGHIAAASNSAFDLVRGDYVALLDHDHILPEHALLCVAETLARFPEAAVLYSDEDKLDADGHRCDPHFKSDWNLELFRGQNLVAHLGVYRADLVRAVGAFRAGFDGAQDYDLAFRCIEAVARERVVHIPHVLYHARNVEPKPYAHASGKRALEEHFARIGIACDVASPESGGYRCDYRLPTPTPKVAILVVDNAGRRRLRKCLDEVRRTPYPDFRVGIVSGGDGKNLVDACNRAIGEADADVIAIVDSRCRFVTEDWLRPLVARACLPEVGAVGARLLSRSGRLVGNAQLLGARGTYAPLGLGTRAHRSGYFGRARLAQQVGALADGCVVAAKRQFIHAGWLDPTFRDMGAALVDFTFRLHTYGLRNTGRRMSAPSSRHRAGVRDASHCRKRNASPTDGDSRPCATGTTTTTWDWRARVSIWPRRRVFRYCGRGSTRPSTAPPAPTRSARASSSAR